jgi:uncharacterized protein
MTLESRLLRIASGRTDLIAELVRPGKSGAADPWPQAQALTLLQWASYYGDVSALRGVLDQGARLSDLGADLGLGAAAFHGHWQLCEFLLEQGAEVGYRDPQTGETALHAALVNEDRARYDLVLEVLLRAGADATAATRLGAPTGSFMRDARTRGESPLHRAAAFGSPATVQRLLVAGANKEQVDGHGDTPLAWASWYRRPAEVLRLLLHGEHRIHPDHRPMRENLLGRPA